MNLRAVKVTLDHPDSVREFSVQIATDVPFQELKDELVRAISDAIGVALDPNHYRLNPLGSFEELNLVLELR